MYLKLIETIQNTQKNFKKNNVAPILKGKIVQKLQKKKKWTPQHLRRDPLTRSEGEGRDISLQHIG